MLNWLFSYRKYFYDHLDKYDLFVYTEDDHDLRPTHFISYMEETEKLKTLSGGEVRMQLLIRVSSISIA